MYLTIHNSDGDPRHGLYATLEELEDRLYDYEPENIVRGQAALDLLRETPDSNYWGERIVVLRLALLP